MKVYKLTAHDGEETYYPCSTTTEKTINTLCEINHGSYEVVELNDVFICEKLNEIFDKLSEFENMFNNLREWIQGGVGCC